MSRISTQSHSVFGGNRERAGWEPTGYLAEVMR
ncbi:hypothetical protein BKA01_002515 [Pseudonocardia eucalypti]|nr:hypothetical protein [Pseudonocardia eucalypti]